LELPKELPAATADDQRRLRQIVQSARAHSMEAAVEKTTVVCASGRRFIEQPPLLYHPTGEADGGVPVDRILESYADHLSPDVRVLFGRYRLIDHAVKVVGVGSIGTRCLIALVAADDGDALILQIKEAVASALEPSLGASVYANHAQRVVVGQRLMQSASDALLGWGTSGERDFYVRQFKDKKGSVNIAALDGFGLRDYAEMCGAALATGHARSGDAAQIAGYLGKGPAFDSALVRFANRYANQVEDDHAAFVAAIRAGDIAVR
jgi:uncharacterized protein (DUF2252 family)